MLLVGGVTYRIERTERHQYTVVRLLDDTEVGTFQTRPNVRIQVHSIDTNLMRDIVRAAMRAARTSAVMHVAPVFEPDRETPVPDRETPVTQPPEQVSSLPPRSPSSAPPPASAHAH